MNINSFKNNTVTLLYKINATHLWYAYKMRLFEHINSVKFKKIDLNMKYFWQFADPYKKLTFFIYI